ncbi:MAG: tRNA uridine-5-carboxymethylaminomethyl(34) synthesis GTPase MnmE [Deltaproteobacteria bacterium]|nr:tRNA uridine-5-carboxymethylaminomethyl(34) synthesis GTPase MnmE [Deltaproteobacteria bacterium]
MYVTDTIAAIATPAGSGAVGIVRVSGPRSTAVAGQVFLASRAPTLWASHRLYHGRLRGLDGCFIDDGLAVIMRAPHSYTGEDVLELHCHGSPVVLTQILANVLRCGVRPAERGEFTKRAFLNGRLDLAQAEAVADLVGARSSRGAALAAAQLGGNLSATLAGIRESLVGLKALLEAQIDFSDEDILISTRQLVDRLDQAQLQIERLDKTYNHGAMIRSGLRIAIVGKPNVGKSSLLNALLGVDRAIVTDQPGTTRDTIEEAADFGGIPVVLTDTAGLRDEGAADAIERVGMQRSAEALQQAQVSLVVLDRSRRLDADDRNVLETAGRSPCVLVLNKSDLKPQIDESEIESLSVGAPLARVSATTLDGLDEIRRAVIRLVDQDPGAENGPVICSARHHAALLQAAAALRLARDSIAASHPPDVIAVDVQDALDHIGAITGSVTSEDVLDRIFSQFCIGK